MFQDGVSRFENRREMSAKHYKNYVIQHEIAPYICDLLKTDIRNNPFGVLFDETFISK